MIHYGLKTIFIHIPRTGGNSISFVLRQNSKNKNDYDDTGHNKHFSILNFC